MSESNGDRLVAWADECLILIEHSKTFRFKAILAQDLTDIYHFLSEEKKEG